MTKVARLLKVRARSRSSLGAPAPPHVIPAPPSVIPAQAGTTKGAWRDEREQPLEMLQHPAVNLENLPRDVAGGGGRQIDRQRGDIVGRAEAAHGDKAEQQIVVEVR